MTSARIEGRLRSGLTSGPITGETFTVETGEGRVSLDQLLRPFRGSVVSITIEELSDAEREDPGPQRYTFDTRDRRRRD